MRHRGDSHRSARRRGTILAAVLVLTTLAAMVAASLLYRMHAERTASLADGGKEQAYLAAMSGIEHALAILKVAASDPEVWTDSPSLLANQLVYEDGTTRWYFTIYAPNPVDDEAVRNGPIDEAGKLNVNIASESALSRLPVLTTEQIDCLLDYRDSDNEPRAQGAEQDYYSLLDHPHVIKNGPLTTVEELLLVKGFDGATVFGEDYNCNGILDHNEDDGSDSFPPDNADGQLSGGLTRLLTVYSYERAVDSGGNARININGDDSELAKLDQAGLPQQTVDFIRTYRREGNVFTHPSQLLEMRYQPRQSDPSSSRGGRGGRNGGERRGEAQQPAEISSGVGAEQLPTVLDRLTTVPAGDNGAGISLGLVNGNTAPAEVLVAQGMEAEAARQVVEVRGQLSGEKRVTPAWLYTENLLSADAFKTIAPGLTSRSFQYRFRCVGFGAPKAPGQTLQGRFCVLEAVVDLAAGQPRIVYLRELTRLGLPVSLDVEAEEK